MLSSPPRVPRRTLAWGGAGIIVASVLPLAWQVLHVVPMAARLWLNYAWEPISGAVCAAVLVAAYAVLAVGVGRESGIVGTSWVGKTLLILTPALGLAVDLLNFAPLSPMTYLPASAYDGTGQVDQHALMTVLWVLEGVAYLGHAALIAASVFVIRAGAVRGAARWGLAVLAVANVVLDLAWSGVLGSGPQLIPLLSWGAIALALIQLVIGVLFVLQARVATVSPRLTLVAE